MLKQEEMWDMSLGGESRENEIPHVVGNLCFGFVAFILKICFRYRIDGRENLQAFKGRSGVVVVCNHTSYLDTAFVYVSARPGQWIRLMARESLFEPLHGLLGQIFSRVGAFPIKRDSADRKAIKRASNMLKNKEVVGIFPEGTRRGKGSQTPELHGGAAFVAKLGKAPILPMTVREAENIKQKGKRLRFPKVTIEFGRPILVSDFDFLPKDERLEACTWYAMRECFALSYRTSAEEVDMKALYPDAKDYTQAFEACPVPTHTSEELVSLAGKAKADAEVLL